MEAWLPSMGANRVIAIVYLVIGRVILSDRLDEIGPDLPGALLRKAPAGGTT